MKFLSDGRPRDGSAPGLVACVTRVVDMFLGSPRLIAEYSRRAVVSVTKAVLLRATRRSPRLPVRLARLITVVRLRLGTPRTVWGVTPILTLPLLARCDRLLGLRSDSLVFTTYYTSSRFDVNLKRIDRWLATEHPEHYENFARLVLAFALLRYDMFHFYYDRGVMVPVSRMHINETELKALRTAGKRIYFYAYGADVRTRRRTLALGQYNLCRECPEPSRFCVCDDTAGEARMQGIAGYANAMVSMGDMLTYVPNARNMHYWPLDLTRLKPGTRGRVPGQRLRVAHAPNHPHFKGTRYLEEVICRLQGEGVAVELVRVQGVPNEQVLDLFRGADLVADQFIAGFHGYTALEAMALGKPVICFLRGPEMAIDPAECPIINANPDTLYEVLKGCATGKYDLEAIGARSRAYVEKHYSLEAVAARLGQLYLETAGLPLRLAARIRARSSKLGAECESRMSRPRA